MEMESILSSVLLLFIGVGITALGYLTNRLISDNDKLHTSTKNSIKALRDKLHSIDTSVYSFTREVNEINKAVKRMEANVYNPEEMEKLKRKMSSILIMSRSIEKDLNFIMPQVQVNKQGLGSVTWLKDEIRNQNKKLSTMFETLEIIARRK